MTILITKLNHYAILCSVQSLTGDPNFSLKKEKTMLQSCLLYIIDINHLLVTENNVPWYLLDFGCTCTRKPLIDDTSEDYFAVKEHKGVRTLVLTSFHTVKPCQDAHSLCAAVITIRSHSIVVGMQCLRQASMNEPSCQRLKTE